MGLKTIHVQMYCVKAFGGEEEEEKKRWEKHTDRPSVRNEAISIQKQSDGTCEGTQ